MMSEKYDQAVRNWLVTQDYHISYGLKDHKKCRVYKDSIRDIKFTTQVKCESCEWFMSQIEFQGKCTCGKTGVDYCLDLFDRNFVDMIKEIME